MARLHYKIQEQAYELIRRRVFAILGAELLNQLQARGNYEADATVFLERFKPINDDECPVVLVQLAKGDYNGQTILHQPGTYRYFIDVYTSAPTEGMLPEDSGDSLSILRLTRLMGICRAILEAPEYVRLGYDTTPVVGRRYIENIIVADPKAQDSANCVMGRLVLVVQVNEDAVLNAGNPLEGVGTTVAIGNSDVGLYYANPSADTPPPVDPVNPVTPTPPANYFAWKVLQSIADYSIGFTTTALASYVFDGTINVYNPTGKDLRNMQATELYMGGFLWSPLASPADYTLDATTGTLSFGRDIVPGDYCLLKYKPIP